MSTLFHILDQYVPWPLNFIIGDLLDIVILLLIFACVGVVCLPFYLPYLFVKKMWEKRKEALAIQESADPSLTNPWEGEDSGYEEEKEPR